MKTTIAGLLKRLVPDKKDRLHQQGEIARGGMGAIEAVYDRLLRRQLAMKIIHTNLQADTGRLEDFVREAQITGQLEHPNIVPVHDLGETGEGRVYFTMKMVEGETLADHVAALPKTPLSGSELLEVLDAVVKVADALSFAHSRGVIHCDVNPRNVMLGEFGQVYLMDWGIARLTGSRGTARSIRPPMASLNVSGDQTLGNRVLGSPNYMPPEQAQGPPRLLDERTDVFALGALLYRVLGRRPPYRGKTAEEALEKARRADFPPLASVVPEGAVPRQLDRIVAKAMARDPVARYRSVEQMRQELTRFMRGSDFPRVRYRPGEHIVREGDPGGACFIVQAGRCEVYKTVNGQRSSIRFMGPGEVFGETALLTGMPRTASVVASESTTVFVVTSETLDDELDTMKPWMGALVRTLARRFREREQERDNAPPRQRDPTQLAHFALLYMNTYGAHNRKGGCSMSWPRLARAAERHLGEDPTHLAAALGQFPEFRRDTEVCAIDDLKALAKKLNSTLST